MQYNPYSYSKWSLYKQCARKFKYKYIDRIKVEMSLKHLNKGNYIHDVLEHIDSDKVIDPTEYDIGVEDACEYNDMLLKFVNSEFAKVFLAQGSEGTSNEASFGLDTNMKVTEYKHRDPSVLYLGKIDRINFFTTSMHLIDWKTGKVREDRTQLRHYALWALTRFPNVERLVVSYVYVEHHVSLDEVVTREDLKGVTVDLLSGILEIEQEQVWRKSETPLCNYCEYGPHHANICDIS
jgi:CRISPR/Cas system-associated exonuclease Cas4 (RecB family)